MNRKRSSNIPLLLAHARVHRNAGKVALAQELVELGGTQSRLDKDDDLVELEIVQELIELPVLLALGQFNVVLLETVQSQLCLVVDIDLQGILHELLADGSSFLGQRSREHHDLLLGRGCAENFLYVATHVFASGQLHVWCSWVTKDVPI